jgi:hypothetical protein
MCEKYPRHGNLRGKDDIVVRRTLPLTCCQKRERSGRWKQSGAAAAFGIGFLVCSLCSPMPGHTNYLAPSDA